MYPAIMEFLTTTELKIVLIEARLLLNCFPLCNASEIEDLRVVEDCCRMAMDETENFVGLNMALAAQKS